MKGLAAEYLEKLKNALDPPTFNEYRDRAREVNSETLMHLIVDGIVLFSIDYLFQMIIGHRTYFGYCFYFLILFVFLLGCAQLGDRTSFRYATAKLYTLTIVLLVLAAVLNLGVMSDDGVLLYMVFLAVLPPLIFDKPWHVLVLIAVMDIMYVGAVEAFVDVPEDALRYILYALLISVVSTVLTVQNVCRRLQSISQTSTASAYAVHDPLTELLNRRGGQETMNALITSGVPGAFIILDIDDFKRVNDTYGHKRGDEVLVGVSGKMRECFRTQDVLMRYGGDEFMIYAVRMVDRNTIEERLRNLNQSVKSIVLNDETGDVITVSIGCCVNDSTYPSYESCFTIADHLLYKTKQTGKDGFRCVDYSYDEERNRKYQEELKKADEGSAKK